MRIPSSLAAALPMFAVAITLSCVFLGWEPIAADPDLMYRPIKAELAESLAQGKLPFWSHRLGLGVPLVAESHVAAFYPPNWVAYRALELDWAFRLSMWIHGIATAAAMYAYARVLGLDLWGASLSAVSFSLCGFATSHSGHEPLYLLMPYLPLCLTAADRFATTGRPTWLALLALAWGLQLTIGHFQIQMWTAGLALLGGIARLKIDGLPKLRGIGLFAGLMGGLSIASVQLALTWELTRVSGFSRSSDLLAAFPLPPSHWFQLVLPSLFANASGAEVEKYWGSMTTSPVESSFYTGTIPLVFAIIGMLDSRRPRRFVLWKILIVASLVLATLPRWWPTGYWLVTLVPGFGLFRCPGRYTLIASLGLALLAGHGMDRLISAKRFVAGILMGALLGVLAVFSALKQLDDPLFRASLGQEHLMLMWSAAIGCWVLALVLAALWRRRLLPSCLVVAAAAIELAVLFHFGPVTWGWTVPFPAESPIGQRLLQDPDVELITGPLLNLPVRVGLTCAYPYLGITPPPPNYLLEQFRRPPALTADPAEIRNLQRFGVTHGVWHQGDLIPGTETLLVSPDPILDRLIAPDRDKPPGRPWKLVRYKNTWPAAWVSRSALTLPGWGEVYTHLLHYASPDESVYLAEDAPAAPQSRWATTANLQSWDGTTAVVTHDGACDLGIRRTFYPGWTFSVNGSPPKPVLKANGGLQAVRLDGQGTSRILFAYEPTNLRPAAAISLIATTAALVVLGFGSMRLMKRNQVLAET